MNSNVKFIHITNVYSLQDAMFCLLSANEHQAKEVDITDRILSSLHCTNFNPTEFRVYVDTKHSWLPHITGRLSITVKAVVDNVGAACTIKRIALLNVNDTVLGEVIL